MVGLASAIYLVLCTSSCTRKGETSLAMRLWQKKALCRSGLERQICMRCMGMGLQHVHQHTGVPTTEGNFTGSCITEYVHVDEDEFDEMILKM